MLGTPKIVEGQQAQRGDTFREAMGWFFCKLEKSFGSRDLLPTLDITASLPH